MKNILAILSVKIVIIVLIQSLFFALVHIVDYLKKFILKANNFEHFLSTPKPTI